LAIFQIFACALKVAKSRPFVSTLENRIHDLEGERQRSEEAAAKYKDRSEKLKKKKEALEATKNLQH